MICYRDMTFCPFWLECVAGFDCHRAFTDEHADAAERGGWHVSLYADRPDCFAEVEE